MICKNCGTQYEGKFCPECGSKSTTLATEQPAIQQTAVQQEMSPSSANTVNKSKPSKVKKPIYKKWWFYVIIAIVVVAVITSLSGREKTEKIDWKEIVLSDYLPEPPKNNAKIHENTSEELYVEIQDVSDKQYTKYIDACKSKGFTVDSETDSTSFKAYNSAGYKLRLSHYDSKDNMEIELKKPIEMSNITWPTGKAGSKLPAPKSTIGKFNFEYDDNFSVYIGNTGKADYDNYVKACSDKGFNVDYNKGDTYYYADNEDGWHISVEYEGNNTMLIHIEAPSKETSNSTAASKTAPVKTTEPSKSKAADSDLVNGMHRDFKEAMDSYEQFFDEYVAFMKKYNESNNSIALLADYTDFLNKYTETMQKMDEWENKDLNEKETAYYIEVSARINKKLLEVVS